MLKRFLFIKVQIKINLFEGKTTYVGSASNIQYNINIIANNRSRRVANT